jgi:hypothetical protein
MNSPAVGPTSRGLRSSGIRALVAASVGLVALTTFAAGPAAASDDVVVSFRDCLLNGGTTTVPSGVPITIGGIGFAEGTYGLIQDFLLKQQTTLTVSNATTVSYNLSRAWQAPQQLDRKLWVSRLPDTDVGVTLGQGETLLATYDITFPHGLLVAYPRVGSSGDNGPFMVSEEGPIPCQVEAD